MTYAFRRLGADDLHLFRSMLGVFADGFGERETYLGAMPDDAYVKKLLASETFIALVALDGNTAVGALAAYVLDKFERQRREIYIYDLAVTEAHRRRGVATGLINELRRIAAGLGAYVIFVQADPPDEPAVRLYEKLGVREDVLHFDISVP